MSYNRILTVGVTVIEFDGQPTAVFLFLYFGNITVFFRFYRNAPSFFNNGNKIKFHPCRVFAYKNGIFFKWQIRNGKFFAVRERYFFAVHIKNCVAVRYRAVPERKHGVFKAGRRKSPRNTVALFTSERLEAEKMHMGVVASVAQTASVQKVTVAEHPLEHSVRVFTVPRARHCVGVFLIIVCVFYNALFGRDGHGSVIKRQFERSKIIDNAVLRKFRVVYDFTPCEKSVFVYFRERNIRVHSVFPQQLISVRVICVIGAALPQMIGARHRDIGYGG